LTDVILSGGDVSDRQPKHELPMKVCSRKVCLSAGIDAVEQIAIVFIRPKVTEAYQRKQHRGGQFKARVGSDEGREILCQFQVLAKNLRNPLPSEIPQNEP